MTEDWRSAMVADLEAIRDLVDGRIDVATFEDRYADVYNVYNVYALDGHEVESGGPAPSSEFSVAMLAVVQAAVGNTYDDAKYTDHEAFASAGRTRLSELRSTLLVSIGQLALRHTIVIGGRG